MQTEVSISELLEPSLADQEFELAERKGTGHPDVLCDGIADRVSHEYVRWCIDHLGGVMHHNFDKVLLAAGQAEVRFGGGRIVHPIRILVGGRAAHDRFGQTIPVEDIVLDAATRHLAESMANLDPARHCTFQSLVRTAEPRLIDLAHEGLANDTISCCAVWPWTPLENTVFDTVRYLKEDLAVTVPVGEDVKVSAYRLRGEIHMIVAAPLLALKTRTLKEYMDYKHSATDHLVRHASNTAKAPVHVTLNAADDISAGKVYLTLTGTSGEMADDGSVGRGNRPSGLTAPLRPSTTPAAGKNPISHPGKLYNVMAQRIARSVVDESDGVSEARVTLLTAIGRPLRTPMVANIAVRLAAPNTFQAIRGEIDSLARRTLSEVDDVIRGLVQGYPRLY